MYDRTDKAFIFSNNNLDLIRLFAAVQVVITHAFAHLNVKTTWQHWMDLFPGVPIFFFISGLLICRSYARSDSLSSFFSNRFLRIYPALWVCLFLSILSLFVVGYLFETHVPILNFGVWVLAQSTFLQFFNPEFLRGFGTGVLNGSLWTITVELQFYLLTPLVFWVMSKRRVFFLIFTTLFLLANILKNVMPIQGVLLKLYLVTFVPWLGMFLLGAWLSIREDIIQLITRLRLIHIILLFVVVDLVCFKLGLVIGGNEINLISFLCLILLIIKVAYTKPFLSRLLLKNNDISYGVYIYHMPVVNVMIYFGLLGKFYFVLYVMIIVFILAALSWFLVEKPILSLKKRTIRLL